MITSPRRPQGTKDEAMGRFFVEVELANFEDIARARAGMISDRDIRRERVRALVDSGAALLVLRTPPQGVKKGGVMAPAEVAADFFEAVASVPPAEVHADLAREGDGFVATF